ncbi:MAG: hypothetical protein LC804_28080 [Acidobacteria bacterium]|nr:hypothetical protein [Acidobacteriota bacterium]
MAGRTSAAWGADLVRGAARFADWRRRREMGARIPAPLWDLAVELAARHGVSRTSQALRVDYYSLQERVEARGLASAPSATVAKAMPSTFVELPTAPFGSACECSIEFEKPCGAKLRVQLRGPQLLDLAVLGRQFWESR